ncbi:hypothetical protein HMF8227_01642 [Saliniradius amylolyticus]|uniref:PNPLA domain-containing protein n=1 Tax=Saliniradius amylolyticus TaxID=2183582 RepID=A0A2S2E388_9ALTE|nr:hypothetical protein [Saliniradius amylolyticus]AWL12115.1 hypothetical protein HMF8227_01642 [Saliniradius amylolyticus]
MALLDIYAGRTAYRALAEQGLKSELFDFMLGASGGPKWFVLAGLDRVIFPSFFAGRSRPLHALGSSAGAFRFACFAQSDPLAAINRLAEHYSHTVYSDRPDAAEISAKGRQLLTHVLGQTGVEEIIQNPVIKAHFIVARSRGLTRFERKEAQLLGLLGAASGNALGRRQLRHFFERFVFSADTELMLGDPSGITSQFVPLRSDNLQQALMASGSIPLVLEGVKDIAGAPPGMYRDGGIIDYHFDLTLQSTTQQQGLVLYPHFWPKPAPGWFDKRGRRQPHKASYDNVVMLVPSAEFIGSLPYGKIPDRKDFETMPPEQRIPYWQEVIRRSDELGQAFVELTHRQDLTSVMRPIEFTRN